MKIALQVPKSIEDITLGQYQKFMALDQKDENLNHKAIEIFCNIPIIAVRGMKKVDIDFALAGINEMVTDIKNKLDNNEAGELQRKINLGGVNFGYIPKLDEISEGEYLDLQLYLPDWQKMHNAMAILYRPITIKKLILGNELYRIEDYETSYKYCEVMQNMKMDIVIDAMVFFYRLSNELLNAIQVYLVKQMKKTEIQEAMTRINLPMEQYLALQVEISSNYKKLLKPIFMKPLLT